MTSEEFAKRIGGGTLERRSLREMGGHCLDDEERVQEMEYDDPDEDMTGEELMEEDVESAIETVVDSVQKLGQAEPQKALKILRKLMSALDDDTIIESRCRRKAKRARQLQEAKKRGTTSRGAKRFADKILSR